MSLDDVVESVHVAGGNLVDKVKELIHEGNVERVIIKDEHGHTYVEIPVTLALVGALLAPVLAAVGAIAALVSKFTIIVERKKTAETTPSTPVRM